MVFVHDFGPKRHVFSWVRILCFVSLILYLAMAGRLGRGLSHVSNKCTLYSLQKHEGTIDRHFS